MPPMASPRVTLHPMTTVEWHLWYAAQRADYVEQMVRHGGMSRDDAEAKAEQDHARLLPLGQATPQHHFSVARSHGSRVGTLWLAEQRDDAGPLAWVYNVETEPGERRKGYGRALMLLAEDVAAGLGLERIGLNVFAGNTAAIALYDDLGYEVVEADAVGQRRVKRLAVVPSRGG